MSPFIYIRPYDLCQIAAANPEISVLPGDYAAITRFAHQQRRGDGTLNRITFRFAGADIAAGFGREIQAFKSDARKLKALGLTESLEVGFRLSARGRAALKQL